MQPKVHLAPVSPWDQGQPAIHGPAVYGASVNTPYLYAVPAHGAQLLRIQS